VELTTLAMAAVLLLLDKVTRAAQEIHLVAITLVEEVVVELAELVLTILLTKAVLVERERTLIQLGLVQLTQEQTVGTMLVVVAVERDKALEELVELAEAEQELVQLAVMELQELSTPEAVAVERVTPV